MTRHLRSIAVAQLGDVAEFIRGITFKPTDVISVTRDDAVACFRTSNVQTDLDLRDVWGLPAIFVKRPEQYLRRGDILVSSANSWSLVGKCCYVPELYQKAVPGGFISALRSKPNVECRYLYWLFASGRFQAEVRGCARQTTNIANLSFDQCLALDVPLPPLDEQRRIAAILDQADDLRRKRRAALERLDQLAAVSFSSMFGDPLSNSKGWPSGSTLGELALIASGVTKGRRLDGATAREVPYMAVANVQDRALQLTSVKSLRATEDEIARYRLLPGDLLLTEGGDPDKLGRGTLWQGELPECIHQNHIFRVRLSSDLVEPTFLNWLVASERGKRYFLQSAKQTTGIASINMGQLRDFPVLLPPVELQRAFAKRVAEIDKLKATHRAHLAKLDALFASLQHRAFRGEL